MSEPTIVVGLDPDTHDRERVFVSANRVDRDRDGVVRCYVDDTEVATFYDARYAVREENLQG